MVKPTSPKATRTDTGATLGPAAVRGQMRRVSIRTLTGDSPTVMLASCLRFCVDGTLRGSDHCIVAHSSEGFWKVGGKLHRELDCDGPVRVRLVVPGRDTPLEIGPFAHLRTTAGVLYADDVCLNILMPGRQPRRYNDCVQLTLIWEGMRHGQA
jgi:hypothetical protein